MLLGFSEAVCVHRSNYKGTEEITTEEWPMGITLTQGLDVLSLSLICHGESFRSIRKMRQH